MTTQTQTQHPSAEMQELAAESIAIIESVAGRPISQYLEEPETTDGLATLWLWPTELEDEDSQRAAALGIQKTPQGLSLIDGYRTLILRHSTMDEALKLAGRRLSAGQLLVREWEIILAAVLVCVQAWHVRANWLRIYAV